MTAVAAKLRLVEPDFFERVTPIDPLRSRLAMLDYVLAVLVALVVLALHVYTAVARGREASLGWLGRAMLSILRGARSAVITLRESFVEKPAPEPKPGRFHSGSAREVKLTAEMLRHELALRCTEMRAAGGDGFKLPTDARLRSAVLLADQMAIRATGENPPALKDVLDHATRIVVIELAATAKAPRAARVEER